MSNKKAANGGFLRCGTTSSGELALRTGSDEIAERHQLSATQIRGSVHTGNEFVVAHLVAFAFTAGRGTIGLARQTR